MTRMRPGSWQMVGGLDLVTPRISRSKYPGGLTLCLNHEAREEGYRRIDGFVRFDGRPDPSELPYPVRTDTAEQRAAKEAAIAARRALIGEVPGTGDPVGVWRFNERTYAFRRAGTDDAPGNTIGVYRSGATGWEEVTLGHRLHWRAGAGTPPVAGTVLTVGTAGVGNPADGRATIRRLVRTRGEFSDGSAEGFCLVDTVSGGFGTGDILAWSGQIDATDMLTVHSAVEAQSIAWGSAAHCRFDNFNFYGQDELERMYMVSGTDYGWEFDGSLWTPLITGTTNDTPIFVAVHQDHVFVAYPGGSIVHSGLGEAVNFEAIQGAAEIAGGEEPTGLLSGYRNSLFIFGRNQTLILQGTDAATWNLFVFDREAGAMPNSVQLLDEPTSYDDRGIRGIEAVDAYGDFSISSNSGRIRPMLDRKRRTGALPIASCRVRTKSQYRLWFDDGDCIVMAFNMSQRGRVYKNFTLSRYELEADDGALTVARLNHVASVEDDDGREVIFFTVRGSGYVYQMDKGINFDGGQVRAIMQCPFNDFGKPAIVKRFRKLQVECDVVDVSRFRVAADFDDGKQTGQRTGRDFEVSTRGGRWSEDNWSEFRWSAIPQQLAETRISGRGRNIAPLIYSRGNDIPPYVVSGMTVLYEDRKIQR